MQKEFPSKLEMPLGNLGVGPGVGFLTPVRPTQVPQNLTMDTDIVKADSTLYTADEY